MIERQGLEALAYLDVPAAEWRYRDGSRWPTHRYRRRARRRSREIARKKALGNEN